MKNLRAHQYIIYNRIMKSINHRSESMKKRLFKSSGILKLSLNGSLNNITIQYGMITLTILLCQYPFRLVFL